MFIILSFRVRSVQKVIRNFVGYRLMPPLWGSPRPIPRRGPSAANVWGGPKVDPKGIDPDGDGFACYWDPKPFRSVLKDNN